MLNVTGNITGNITNPYFPLFIIYLNTLMLILLRRWPSWR